MTTVFHPARMRWAAAVFEKRYEAEAVVEWFRYFVSQTATQTDARPAPVRAYPHVTWDFDTHLIRSI